MSQVSTDDLCTECHLNEYSTDDDLEFGRVLCGDCLRKHRECEKCPDSSSKCEWCNQHFCSSHLKALFMFQTAPLKNLCRTCWAKFITSQWSQHDDSPDNRYGNCVWCGSKGNEMAYWLWIDDRRRQFYYECVRGEHTLPPLRPWGNKQ